MWYIMEQYRSKQTGFPITSSSGELDWQISSTPRGRPTVRNQAGIPYLSCTTPQSGRLESSRSLCLPSPLQSESDDVYGRRMPLLTSPPSWPTTPHLTTRSPTTSETDISRPPCMLENPFYDSERNSSSPTFISTSPIEPIPQEDQWSSPSYRSATPIQDECEPSHSCSSSPLHRLTTPFSDVNETVLEPWSPLSNERPIIWSSEVDVQIFPTSTLHDAQTTSMSIPHREHPERASLSVEHRDWNTPCPENVGEHDIRKVIRTPDIEEYMRLEHEIEVQNMYEAIYEATDVLNDYLIRESEVLVELEEENDADDECEWSW